MIDHVVHSSIGSGLVLLVGIAKKDGSEDVDYLIDKISHLRIFEDQQGKMNQDIRQAGGGILLVSNFTVYGETSKGRRPSFDAAAPASQARGIYEELVQKFRQTGIPIETGVFQADMLVRLENDGPVTLICESR